MRKVLGIDPGLSGGISIIDEQLNVIACHSMPVKMGKDGKYHVDPCGVRDIIAAYTIDLAIIEKVGSMPKQGVTSMFNFGDGYGIVRGIAEIFADQTIYTRPQEWQGFQYLTGLSKDQIGEVAFEVFQAEEMYNGVYSKGKRKGEKRLLDGISDSLMIAKYGIRFLE